MKFAILASLALGYSLNAMAAKPSQSIEQFCADRANGASFAKELIQDSSNLMSFTNRGGLVNGGVCWWHSRFQRNSLFLTIYRPAEKQPSEKEAEKLIGKIRDGKDIVTIPGFRNFSEFSSVHRDLIQKELEKWQKADGIVRFNWVNGLSGKTIVSAEKMKELMDELYDYVEVSGNIAYQKLQLKGVTAHAWLVINMKKVSNGYDLEVLDSNFPNRTNIYKYREGMTNFQYPGFGAFTPYLERVKEMNKVEMTILKECDPAEYEARKNKGVETNEEQNG